MFRTSTAVFYCTHIVARTIFIFEQPSFESRKEKIFWGEKRWTDASILPPLFPRQTGRLLSNDCADRCSHLLNVQDETLFMLKAEEI